MAYAEDVMDAKAYAKVNLMLAVAPPEPAGPPGHGRAGWHRICSWFHAIDLHDTIEMERASGNESNFEIGFEVGEDGRGVGVVDWPMERDLAVRAHAALEREVGRVLPVRMRVRKRIPAGGGLGGGSSDAATVLRVGNELFDLGLTHEQLVKLGRGLGSDVEFFLDEGMRADVPRAALVEGFGDVVTRVGRMRETLTLIVPGIGCPTPEVYREWDGLGRREFQQERVRSAVAECVKMGRVRDEVLFNDLTEPACVVRPELRGVMEWAEEALGPVHVSGSGSTSFVLGHAAAERAGTVLVRTRLL